MQTVNIIAFLHTVFLYFCWTWDVLYGCAKLSPSDLFYVPLSECISPEPLQFSTSSTKQECPAVHSFMGCVLCVVVRCFVIAEDLRRKHGSDEQKPNERRVHFRG